MQILNDLGSIAEKSIVVGSLKAPSLQEAGMTSAVSICASIVVPGSGVVIYSALYVACRIVHIAIEFFAHFYDQKKKLEDETLELLCRLKNISALEDLNEEDFKALRRSLEQSHSIVTFVSCMFSDIADKLGKKIDDVVSAVYGSRVQVESIRNRIELDRQLSASIRARCERINTMQLASSAQEFAMSVDKIMAMENCPAQSYLPQQLGRAVNEEIAVVI